uniref:Costars family protein ABRACL n=1 Tax=Esox lucius TaxID=8010 RepID=A0AAY5L3H7_ESOLU
MSWPISDLLTFLMTDADGKMCVKFGVLFNDDRCANIFEALVGTLRAAKRKKIITFEGELLLQGVHDNVDITLLQE